MMKNNKKINVNVSKLGKYNLININGYSTFSMGIVTPKEEKDNILDNWNNILKNYEKEAFNKIREILNLLEIKCLDGYKFKLKTNNNMLSFILPVVNNILSQIQIIKLSDKEKSVYQDAEKYHFYGIQSKSKKIDKKDTFGEFYPQGILLIPIKENEKSYIENFISDVIYEKYYTSNNEKNSNYDNFLFHNHWIKEKYSFLPVCKVF